MPDIDVGAISEALNDKLDRDVENIATSGKTKIVSWGMPDYSRGVTFSANTPVEAPYDCIVFWNTSAATNNPAYFYISATGAFAGEELTFPFYANADGYQTKTFSIPKGWYFKTSRNFEAAQFSPSQYFPLKGV